ncbi:hypothetical protein PhCBS80983_g03740 [Powellomyces hirtus]|uniref:Zinc/iron permease n=1 Tax=Powellomyces hirtus TaxID=109895 RepID=A0A507E3C4_9FUNG|nr:hypothetical protein PhCBS80983_g03740 [Powellomyces hirtus]
MFTGSFLAGNIPLAFHFSEERLQIVSTFGSGMLVGTALIVILPEGVDTLYSMQIGHGDGDTHAHSTFEAHRYIGAALAIGFAFMFLIDNAGGHRHKSPSHIVTVNDFREVGSPEQSRSVNTATVGLVVHAAADGVALGAASATDRGSLELIVFFAIMLHKAPSAFGLATFLLADGYSRKSVQQHLLVFSVSAPLAGIATFMFLSGNGVSDPVTMAKWTGILLLFSAGTFLYVATMHILPEIYSTSRGRGSSPHDKRLSLAQVVCLLAGIFTPLLLAVEHSH